jgi:hypothetical protein
MGAIDSMTGQQSPRADESPNWPKLATHRPQSSHFDDDVGDFLLPEKAMTSFELFATWFSGALILLTTIALAVMFVR